jgi:hypothetical protein
MALTNKEASELKRDCLAMIRKIEKLRRNTEKTKNNTFK